MPEHEQWHSSASSANSAWATSTMGSPLTASGVSHTALPAVAVASTASAAASTAVGGFGGGGFHGGGGGTVTSEPERYELLVLGSGEGGKYLACTWPGWVSARRSRAQAGRRFLSNTNCLPSKNEIWSAKVAEHGGHADRFGMVTGPTAVDMTKVLARKRQWSMA